MIISAERGLGIDICLIFFDFEGVIVDFFGQGEFFDFFYFSFEGLIEVYNLFFNEL